MKIHKEGFFSIALVLVLALVISVISLYLSHGAAYAWIISAIVFSFAIFVVSFFRSPKRIPNGDSQLISAPADGTIIIIKEVEEGEYLKKRVIQVSVFMSFFNVHVNWYPMSGVISYYKYHPGDYLAAWHPKSSEKNERSTIVIKNENGEEILFRQIAGLFARRVVSYSEYDKEVKAGDEAGFIKFGSRADIFLPLDSELLVKKGDNVKGAETIIAKLSK